MEGVPESGRAEIRAAQYGKGSMYKGIQASRGEKEISEGRTRIFPHS
jgi:hypothetical protein